MKNISVEEAKKEFDKGTEFIDIREVSENEELRIPGSILIPLSEMNARFKELPKDKTVVVYCRSGARSANLLSQIVPMGYDNLINMLGGINDWEENEYPTEQG